MKNLFVVVLLSIVASTYCISYIDVLKEEWQTFKLRFEKSYNSETEESFRMKIFADNKHRIAKHNQLHYTGKVSFKTKLNEYSDMLPQEFFATMNGFLYNSTVVNARDHAVFIGPDDDVLLPKTVDWRQKGAVTEVKNQMRCGSCWAFSTTGALEGQHFRKTGKLVSLSEQNLVDCSKENEGCNGGDMDFAFDFIKANGGIDTEASYPYVGSNSTGQCQFKARNVGATDKGHVDLRNGSENALKKAVATIGPIAVAIDASEENFMSYAGGVYFNKDCNPEGLDHGVLAVGYGTSEDGEDYWLVKNSWGSSWGLDGYIMMARNRDNNCGISTMASYPLV